jgi:hypothetical protein
VAVVGEAVTAGVIGEADTGMSGAGVGAGRLAFRHGLIRKVLYGGMPRAVREALHVEAARALASAGAVPERLAAQLAAVPESAAAGHCRGLADDDPAPVLAAAVYYQSAGRPLEHALALEDAAVLLAARGDLPAARRASGEAA